MRSPGPSEESRSWQIDTDTLPPQEPLQADSTGVREYIIIYVHTYICRSAGTAASFVLGCLEDGVTGEQVS